MVGSLIYASTRKPWPTKPVRDSPEWAQLGRDYINKTGDYLDLMWAISTQHVICPWLKKPWRVTKNFLGSQFVGLDIDDETIEASLSTILKIRTVQKFGTLAYTTQSHESVRPRGRVIFCTNEPCWDAAKHRRRQRALAWALGGDTQASDAVRAFYGTGPNGHVEYLGNNIPSLLLDDFAAEYDEAMEVNYTRGAPFTGDEQDIADLLARIDPMPGGAEWNKACLAVYSVFPDERGIRLIENWSPGYRDEVRNRFRGFAQNSTGKVTVGSLYYLAKQYPRRKEGG